jgi:uncharacterized membrane protein YdjX (TVP38/TMEM64 family)
MHPQPSLPAPPLDVPAGPRRPWTALALKVLLVVALLALLLLGRLVSLERPLTWLAARVEALGPWGPLAFGGLFVVLTVLLLPATPVVLAAGAVFGTVVGTLLMSLASTVSAALSFLLSRYVAHDRAARLIGHYPRLSAIWHALGERDGWKIVAAVRLSHAMPFGLQSLLFGLSPVRFWPFVAATWVSMLPGTLLYCYLGSLGAAALGAEAAPAGPAGWAVRLGGLVVIGLAVLYVARFARRIIRERTHVDLGADGPDWEQGDGSDRAR